MSDEQTLRVDLAAAFRIAVRFNWHESVGNHFSATTSVDGKQFLLNPRWQHFSTIKASDLLLLDADDDSVMKLPNAPDPSAWCIHGCIHARVPSAKVLLHCHPPYASALACLKDPRLKPIDQNAARFFNRVTVDTAYGGMADEAEEGERLAVALGEFPVMMMGNHGVSVTGETIPEAFEALYYFERSAKTLMLAYASGQPLNVLSDEIAEKTAQAWEAYQGAAYAHFDHLKHELDKVDPSYRD